MSKIKYPKMMLVFKSIKDLRNSLLGTKRLVLGENELGYLVVRGSDENTFNKESNFDVVICEYAEDIIQEQEMPVTYINPYTVLYKLMVDNDLSVIDNMCITVDQVEHCKGKCENCALSTAYNGDNDKYEERTKKVREYLYHIIEEFDNVRDTNT